MKKVNFVFNRAMKLILNPKAEWSIIQAETQTKSATINNYALPWMIIMAVCSFIGDSLFVSNQIGYIVTKAVFIFAVTYMGIYVSALIINELTTSFSSKKDINTVFKLVVYSCTGYFIASSVALLLPPLVILFALGLYSIYLFWEGSSTLLGTPEDNKVGFVVVSSLVMLGIYAILSLMLRAILAAIFNINLAIG
jgi:hypothetical protein